MSNALEQLGFWHFNPKLFGTRKVCDLYGLSVFSCYVQGHRKAKLCLVLFGPIDMKISPVQAQDEPKIWSFKFQLSKTIMNMNWLGQGSNQMIDGFGRNPECYCYQSVNEWRGSFYFLEWVFWSIYVIGYFHFHIMVKTLQ